MSTEDEIRNVLERYAQALNAGDAELAASCYTFDAMFMPSGLPTVSGPAIVGWYQDFFTSTSMDVTFEIDEVRSGDAVAYALTRSHGTQRSLTRGTQTSESNREVFIFAAEGGAWKIARYLFNQPERR